MAISGSTVWGHANNTTQTNTRTFNNGSNGTGMVQGSGDAEKLILGNNQYREFEIVQTGNMIVKLQANVYNNNGNNVTFQYRTASIENEVSSVNYQNYSTPFKSLGFTQIKTIPAISGGVWYYAASNENETVNGDSAYVGACPVTIGPSGNITAVAVKIFQKLSCTQIKVGLYSTTTGTAPLAQGNGTPADGEWCVVPLTYAGNANTTYRVAWVANSNLNQYCDSDGGVGIYDTSQGYANELTTHTWAETAYAVVWGAAICAGGDPGALR